jgi:hypothetical protein
MTMHKRRCQRKRAERLLEGFRIFPLLFAAHFISQQREVNVGVVSVDIFSIIFLEALDGSVGVK